MANKVVTVPNALTAVRLACLPALSRMLSRRDRRARAAVLLGVLGVTDGLDGYIARRFDQASRLGEMADPLVDRAMVLTAVRGALRAGAVPAWLVWLVGARELAAVTGAGIAAASGRGTLRVSWLGKAGAFAMMVALPLFLLGTGAGRQGARRAAWVVTVLGQACAWAALAGYVGTFLRGSRPGQGQSGPASQRREAGARGLEAARP